MACGIPPMSSPATIKEQDHVTANRLGLAGNRPGDAGRQRVDLPRNWLPTPAWPTRPRMMTTILTTMILTTILTTILKTSMTTLKKTSTTKRRMRTTKRTLTTLRMRRATIELRCYMQSLAAEIA